MSDNCHHFITYWKENRAMLLMGSTWAWQLDPVTLGVICKVRITIPRVSHWPSRVVAQTSVIERLVCKSGS